MFARVLVPSRVVGTSSPASVVLVDRSESTCRTTARLRSGVSLETAGFDPDGSICSFSPICTSTSGMVAPRSTATTTSSLTALPARYGAMVRDATQHQRHLDDTFWRDEPAAWAFVSSGNRDNDCGP